MNVSIPFAIPALPTTHPAGRVKAEKAAQDFEAVLLSSLLESLQKSFADTAGESSAGSDNYAAMGTQALASAMSARGGIGIARMILQQWQQTKVLGLNEPSTGPKQ
jgi:Rod binding domain-containing protein